MVCFQQSSENCHLGGITPCFEHHEQCKRLQTVESSVHKVALLECPNVGMIEMRLDLCLWIEKEKLVFSATVHGPSEMSYHKDVVGLWDLSSNAEQLHQVVELTVNVSADCDR